MASLDLIGVHVHSRTGSLWSEMQRHETFAGTALYSVRRMALCLEYGRRRMRDDEGKGVCALRRVPELRCFFLTVPGWRMEGTEFICQRVANTQYSSCEAVRRRERQRDPWLAELTVRSSRCLRFTRYGERAQWRDCERQGSGCLMKSW